MPPFGGDTLFANQYLAYETLSAGMRALLDGLVGVSTSAKADATKTREDRMKSDAREDARNEYRRASRRAHASGDGPQGAVREPCAYRALQGHDRGRERAVARLLYQQQVRPEFTCRFHWEVGSLAFWDNRCTQHNPVNDYHGYRRVMHRITLGGDKPR